MGNNRSSTTCLVPTLFLSRFARRFSPPCRSINFWQHVEKWKKTKSDTEEYRDEAVAVFNDHIDASATQPAEIDKNLRERLAVELMKIEIQEDKKDEVEETKSKGGISGFFARFTKVEETTLRANIFDQSIFDVVLYLRARTWAGFLGSNLGEEWEEYQRKEKAKGELGERIKAAVFFRNPTLSGSLPSSQLVSAALTNTFRNVVRRL